jgi:uncharacterized protein
MAVHIIIDGYNLIRQSHTLSMLDQVDLQAGRDALVTRLISYKRLKHHDITVVFDGSDPSPLFRTRDRIGGIKIEFSRGSETADTVIKRMVKKERHKALVVTSDLDIVHYAQSCSAATIASPDFGTKLEQAAYMDQKGMDDADADLRGWTPTTKKKGPSRRLSKRKRRNQAKIDKL